MGKRALAYSSALAAAMLMVAFLSHAAVIDRVVAYVDDHAITERELEAAHSRSHSAALRPTKAQSLEALINKILIVAEALKLRIEGQSEEELVREYINLKVRAFIAIKEGDVLAHYKENQWKYKGASYDSIKGDIRKLLEEKAVNEKLKRQLKILRKASSIRIMLDPSHGLDFIGRDDP